MKADDFLSVGLANAERCNPGISSFDCVESDKNAVLKKVTVVNMPEDTLVLKLEHIGLEGIVRDKSIPKKWGYNQHSDYVFITADKCIFIEMKSNPKLMNVKEEVRKKFISDNCLVGYFDSIFENLLSKNIFFGKRSFHYVLFHGAFPMSKPNFNPIDFVANDSPNSFRSFSLVDGSKIKFDWLY